jgi:hypothetical protein
MLDKVERRRAVRRPRTQIRIEKYVDALVDLFASDHAHAEAAAHAALGAIGGNDVLRPHAAAFAAAMVGHHRRDAFAILFAGRQLGGKAQLAALPLGRPAQYRFKVVLGAKAVAHRAHRQAPRAGPPGDATFDLFPAQGSRPHDEAGVLGCKAGRADLGLNAQVTVDLHAARVDGAGLGMHGRARVALNEQRGHPGPRQQQRCRQADGPAADDQNGDVDHALRRQLLRSPAALRQGSTQPAPWASIAGASATLSLPRLGAAAR